MGRGAYFGLDSGLGTTPADCCEAVVEVGFVDGDRAVPAAVAVDGADSTERVLEVDFWPGGVLAVRVVVGLGEREWSDGEDCGLHFGYVWYE